MTACVSSSRRAGGACALAIGLLACLDVPAHEAEIDPVGVWSCLMYSPSADQRFYLGLGADNTVRMARAAEADEGVWRPLGEWTRTRDRIEFDDRLNGRLFIAAVGREELGGIWRGVRERGGWWCAAAPHALSDEPPPVNGLLEVLVPAIMASPNYPRRAIREAKEGRTVSCFIVMGTGEIRRPEVVESTDEIFREPTLEAVAASLYRPRGDESAALPACRSFTFELQSEG